MLYGVQQNFILLVVLSNVFTPGNVQIAMPMYMPAAIPQAVYAVPAPVPIAVAIQLPERKTTRTTTTTTTTTKPLHYAVAVPVPVPVPISMQFAVAAQPAPVLCQSKPTPKACPPCPPCVCIPSCTPAFFSYCSPCHQKCRCRNANDAPIPLPSNPLIPVPAPGYPVPLVPAPVGPPPVVVIPLPPIIRKPDLISSLDSSDTSGSYDTSNDRHYLRGRKKLRKSIKKRKRNHRRNLDDKSEEKNDLVKPVLSYVSENGDVKFKTKLSNKDAIEILKEGKIKTSIEKRSENIDSVHNAVIVTNGGPKSGRRYNKVLLKGSPINPELKKGKNKFIFEPPSDKKINNVALSFQVT